MKIGIKMTTFELLLALIRSEVFAQPLSSDITEQIDKDKLQRIYAIAKSHDIAHIIGSALSNNKLLGEDEISQKFQKQTFLAFYRYESINYSFGQIYKLLEEEKIIFVPLKGAVIRDLYPAPWMRTSCDIDILIHEEDLERAIEALVEKAEFTVKGEKNYHDVSLFSPNGVHLELHFNIKENQDNIDRLLSQVWDYCVPIAENDFCYELKNEYFVFHHIAHMSYHFLNGGCGIKPFIDLYLLNDKFEYDIHKAKKLCSLCSLDKFYENVVLLSNVWFGEAAHTQTTKKMQDFLITGGVYGTQKNHISVASKRNGGRFTYMLKRIFMPYRELKYLYPILEKCPLLMPFCHIARWFKIITKGRLKKSVRELNAIKNSDNEYSEAVDVMLRELGL